MLIPLSSDLRNPHLYGLVCFVSEAVGLLCFLAASADVEGCAERQHIGVSFSFVRYCLVCERYLTTNHSGPEETMIHSTREGSVSGVFGISNAYNRQLTVLFLFDFVCGRWGWAAFSYLHSIARSTCL